LSAAKPLRLIVPSRLPLYPPVAPLVGHNGKKKRKEEERKRRKEKSERRKEAEKREMKKREKGE